MWSNSSDSELEFAGGNKNGSKKKSKSGKKPKNKNKPKIKQEKDKEQEKVVDDTKLTLQQGKMSSSSLSSSSEQSSSNSDDDDGGGMGYGKQALGIDPSEVMDYDGTSEPQNGSQYLMAVMKEKKTVPKIVVANPQDLARRMKPLTRVDYLDSFKEEIDWSSLAKTEQANPYVPSQEWRNEKLKDFSLLRSKVDRWKELLAKGVTKMKSTKVKMPELGNRVVWQKFCFGLNFEKLVGSRKLSKDNKITVDTIISDYFKDLKGKEDSVIKSEGDECPLSPGSITTTSHVEDTSHTVEGSKGVEGSTSSIMSGGNNGCQPLMSIMLLLSQKQVEQLIYYQAEWIDQYGFLNKAQGEWLYALLSCVEKPLEPSTMAEIRNICKSLIKVKNEFCLKLSTEKEDGKEKIDLKDLSIESDDSSSSDEYYSEYLNSLNLFIYLVGDYFSQKDLVMQLS